MKTYIKNIAINYISFAIIVAWVFLSSFTNAQEIEWLNIIDLDKPGNEISSINQTSNGNYLITAHDFSGTTYKVLYNKEGDLINQSILDSVANQTPIILEELEPNKFLAVNKSGDVIEIDLTNNTTVGLFTLQNKEESIDFMYGNTHQEVLTIVGKDSANSLNSIHFKINIAQKKLARQYVSDTTLTSVALSYLTSGDMIECFKLAKVVRTNVAGEIVWEITRVLEDFYVEDVVIDTEDNIYLCGTQGKGRDNAALVALDKNGDLLWKHIFENEFGGFEYFYFKHFYKIDITSDGNLIAVGTHGLSGGIANSSVFASEFNNEGKMIWSMDYRISNGLNFATGLLLDGEQIILSGVSNQTYQAGIEKGFLLKLEDLPVIVEDTTTNIINTVLSENPFKLYPNPAQSYIKIDHEILANTNYRVQIINEQGQLIAKYGKAKQIAVNHLSPGKYLISIKTDDFTFTKTWIKVE